MMGESALLPLFFFLLSFAGLFFQATAHDIGPYTGYLWEEFEEPQPGDLRSPCPAINTIANHGLIHRDGKDIDSTDLVEALFKTFGVQREFLTIIVLAAARANGFDPSDFNLDILRGKPWDWFGTGMPGNTFDPDLFFQLKEGNGDKLDKYELLHHASAVIEEEVCEKDLTQAQADSSLNSAVGDLSMPIVLMSEKDFANRVVDTNQFRFFLKFNKFPPGWSPRDVSKPFNVVGNLLGPLLAPSNPTLVELAAQLKPEPFFGKFAVEIAEVLTDVDCSQKKKNKKKKDKKDGKKNGKKAGERKGDKKDGEKKGGKKAGGSKNGGEKKGGTKKDY